MKILKAGELAKQTGINAETLRYYENQGLLPEPQRSDSGYRLYSESDAQKIVFIKRAQELGFTLKEIKELLSLRISPEHSAFEVKKLATQKIVVIDEKIKALQTIETSLIELSDECPGSEGTINDCPIIKCLDSNFKEGGDYRD